MAEEKPTPGRSLSGGANEPLLLCGWWLVACLLFLSRPAVAAGVDHFEIAPIPSPQRGGAPFTLSLTARDTNNAVATNFSGPVQLYFEDRPEPAFACDFSRGLAGWSCWCSGNSSFWPFTFDTDGDGTADGAVRVNLADQCSIYTTMELTTNTAYTLSMDLAFDPGATAGQYFYVDSYLYYGLSPAGIGVWSIGPLPAGQVVRFSVQGDFQVIESGSHLLDIRFWLPMGGGATAYLDNVRIRPRDASPGMAYLSQGQWAGEMVPYRPGTNLVLRALSNAGQTGRSTEFDVLDWQADASLSLAAQQLLPAGVPSRISLLISNSGPSRMEGLTLRCRLPPGTTVADTEPWTGFSLSNNQVVVGLPTVAGQSALPFKLVVQQDQVLESTLEAFLDVPGYDTNASNNTATGSVRFLPLLTGGDVTVTETPAGTNAVFRFQLSAPSQVDLPVQFSVVPLSATPGKDYLAPAFDTLVFPAGVTQQSLTFPILDDPYDEPAEQFAVTLSLSNTVPLLLEREQFQASILDDDPLPALSLTLPPVVPEDAGVLTNAGSLTLSAPLEFDLPVMLTSSDLTELQSPGNLVIPAGETNAVFSLTVVDDLVFDGAQTVAVTAQTTNAITGTGTLVVTDNDPPNLVVTTTIKPEEGMGLLLNAFRVTSPLALPTNLVITLASSDSSELVVPAEVVLLAGRTSTNFSGTVIDDTELDGPQPVTLTATAPGFTSGSLKLAVADNDVHHFKLSSGQKDALFSSVTSTVPFSVNISARDVTDSLISSFTERVSLSATGSLGTVALTPQVTGAFVRGSWLGTVMITNGDHLNVVLVATSSNGVVGFSNPFRVYAAPGQQLRITALELGADPAQLTFASISGRCYRVETTLQPLGLPWRPLLPTFRSTGALSTVTLPWEPTNTASFYRVVLQPD